MKCAFCSHPLGPGDIVCPGCGVPVMPGDPMEEIRRELLAARSETTVILERLERLSGRLEEVRLAVEEVTEEFEVEAPAPAPQPETEPAPAEEVPRAGLGLAEEVAPAPVTRPSIPIPGLSEVKFGQKWLLIIGIVIMVLGVGYFLKYSFERGWVGPAGRVAMSYLAGMACLGAGEAFRRRLSRMFGLYLAGGGIAILYASTFAGFQLYELIGQVPAFGIMVLVTVLAGALSLFYDARWLAVLGIVGGFLTPVIISSGRDQQAALMTYMVILNGGILAIAFFKRWPLLTHLGMGFTWLLFTAWMFGYYRVEKFWLTTAYLNVFFLIYALAPFAYYFVRERTEKLGGYAVSIANTFIAFGFAYITIEEYASRHWASVASVLYAAVFLGLAQYLFRRQRENVDAFVLLLAKAIVFLVLTVPILFTRQWVTVFWTAQAVAIIWAALRLGNRWLYMGGAALLLLAGAKFFLLDQAETFLFDITTSSYRPGYTDMLAARWLTSAVLLGALFLCGRMARSSDRSLDILPGRDPAVLYGAFTAVLFAVLNLEVSAFFADYAPQARFASISVLWTLFSVALMIAGFAYRQGLVRRVALALFALTVLKVFLVDMSRVSTPFRIVSFIVLGLMLIGASYLYHRYRSVILPDLSDEEEAKMGAEL